MINKLFDFFNVTNGWDLFLNIAILGAGIIFVVVEVIHIIREFKKGK